MIDLVALKRFLIKANLPHANGTADIRQETNGSRTIVFRDGEWSMEDNFFGGEPYGGQQAVFYKDSPVWLCVYYGRVDHPEPAESGVYDFLREALQHPEPDKPYRGPRIYKADSLEYKNSIKGEADNFSGHEVILKNGRQIYEATYLGGLIDQRAKGSL